jgi:hypothetical protein
MPCSATGPVRSRRVLVLAQEEARLLSHSLIGNENLLLGWPSALAIAAVPLCGTKRIASDALRWRRSSCPSTLKAQFVRNAVRAHDLRR